MLDNEVTMRVDNFGNKFWRNKNGELHRLDGPAVEYSDGHKEWWLNGRRHREGGPAFEVANDRKEWWLNGLLHRLDGPAFEGADGEKWWYLNGVLHREGGPAIEQRASGEKWWYLNGIRYETKESYFDALSYEGKRLCLISEDFLND